MQREKYKVNIPREKVLTRDYWELLQIDPEHRIEYKNKFLYKDIVFTVGTSVNRLRNLLKLKQLGWKLYETVDLSIGHDTVICRMVKITSFSITVEPSQGSEVTETPLYSFMGKAEQIEINKAGFPNKTYDFDLPEGILYEDWDKDSTLTGKGGADMDDYNLINAMLRANDKRVRDRIKGEKVYDEYELLGKKQCSIGAHSFINRHCKQPAYKRTRCFYHWLLHQSERPGFNPALPDESLHTVNRPYIKAVNIEAIEAKMKQYHEGTKPVALAIDTLKKPRCKHLLYKDECSICLKRPSVNIDPIDGLPVEVDSFMVFNY